MYKLNLIKYKNLRIILTTKYLIFITNNGILKFKTNFFNMFIHNNTLYFNFYQSNLVYNNLILYFTNKYLLYYYLINNQCYTLKYIFNYLTTFYTNLYFLTYNYSLTILLKGVGYKFVLEKDLLKIRIGYSHFIEYKKDKDILFVILNPTTLVLYNNNKYILRKLASFFKSYKKINLYKGTGLFYGDEIITLKKKNNNKNVQ